MDVCLLFFFFFQAEDGIRDDLVTGVQTCALPILVDEWAAGVICYIMLSGTMPFDDENRTRLYRQILTAKYSYTSEVGIN